MKTWKLVAMFAVMMAAVLAVAVNATISPAVVQAAKFYRNTTANITGKFSPGETVIFTNCIMYSDGTGTVQNVTGCTNTIIFVSNSGNSTNTSAATGTNTGVFSFSYTIPTNANSVRFQVRLTDSAGATYIYPPCTLSLTEIL